MSQTLVVDGGQLKRLMGMCRTLCANKGATIQQLQSKLRTSRRTIFRNLNTLEEIGIEVELGEDGYRIKDNVAKCKKMLAESQTKALDKLLKNCLK